MNLAAHCVDLYMCLDEAHRCPREILPAESTLAVSQNVLGCVSWEDSKNALLLVVTAAFIVHIKRWPSRTTW